MAVYRAAEQNPRGFTLRRTIWGYNGTVDHIAWSPDGFRLAAVCDSRFIRVWDMVAERPLYTLEEKAGFISGLAWSRDGRQLYGGVGRSVHSWDLKTGERSVECANGHRSTIATLAWSTRGFVLATGGDDLTVRLWDRNLSRPQRLEGHSRFVNCLAWSADGRWLASGSGDRSIRLWDTRERNEGPARRGHARAVLCLAWSPDRPLLASGSSDATVRLWEPESGQAPVVLEGHTGPVVSVAFSFDGRLLVSKSRDGTVQVWQSDTWRPVAVLHDPIPSYSSAGLAFHPERNWLATPSLNLDHERDMTIRVWELDADFLVTAGPISSTVCYTNAKVVMVGETGVGKTALGHALIGQPFVPTESTHVRHVWLFDAFEVEGPGGQGERRETLLWDLAGNPGYRIFHRQHLDQVAVALVLFDSRSETDPFAGVAYWSRVLDEAARGYPLVKFLVASRTDRGGPSVSQERLGEVCKRFGYHRCFETSARENRGIDELRNAVRGAIPWEKIERIRAPKFFHDMKAFILLEKQAERVLHQRRHLLESYRKGKAGEEVPPEFYDVCLNRIETAGLVKRLSFCDHVLLQPELLDQYCGWITLAARAEPGGLGYISERKARAGEFAMDQDRLLRDRPEEEQLLITATVEEMVGRGLVLRQPTHEGEMLVFEGDKLVFPSELRCDLPEHARQHGQTMVFHFEGPVKAIYATLAVCLSHTPAFRAPRFFRNGALFRSVSDETCGFFMDYPDPENEAYGRLTVFFGETTGTTTKRNFLRYINGQLRKMATAQSVRRERVYQCTECGDNIRPEDVQKRRQRNATTVVCPICLIHIPIDDLAEQCDEYDEVVQEQIDLSAEECERQGRMSVLDERHRRTEYHVFLCHNHADKPSVRQLAERLKEQGILAWYDENGILGGGQFIPELERVIDTVPAAAVVVGPNWLGRWELQEYYALLQRYVEDAAPQRGRLTLIPVLLPGAPPELELPVFLRGFTWVDFRQPGGLENPRALQHLVQSILGKNDILRAETRRLAALPAAE
jgi:WD40 repeat protein